MKLLFVCFLLWSASTTFADSTDDLIKAEMNTRQIPGLVLTIIKDGKAIKTASYGLANLELNVPVKNETVFEIGSVTKQFTAACIMILVQDGKLTLDDPISKHIPQTPETWTKITVRHLLNHTSGVKSYTGLNGFELTKRLTQAQFLEQLGPVPLEFQPGESWKYSNSGYSLLGYIIENASGKSYWDFISERIFKPLGMTSTASREPGVIVTNRADGYETKRGKHINRDYDLTDIFSAGAIISTIGDLAKWNAALDTDKPLTSSSKSEMWTASKLNNGDTKNYGLGWYVETFNGCRNIGHGGATSGFSATFQRFPDEKLAILLLSNTDELGAASSIAKKIAALHLPGKK